MHHFGLSPELVSNKKLFVSFNSGVRCPDLPHPQNGFVSHANPAMYQSEALYHCSTGYGLVGMGTRECLSTGVWSGAAPTCQRETKTSTHIHVKNFLYSTIKFLLQNHAKNFNHSLSLSLSLSFSPSPSPSPSLSLSLSLSSWTL